MDKALHLFVDSPDFYLESLREFLDGGEMDALLRAIEAEEHEAAMDRAFDIRSVSGALGITDVFGMTERLFFHIRNKKNENIREDIADINERLSCLRGLKWEKLFDK